jgi:uncharacterized RDD family membrane protein YckC
MSYCPNSDCPHRQRLGEPAEFNPGIKICSDCGSTLSETAPNFESIRKSKKVPNVPSVKERWTCPECGSVNAGEISLCTCGYDSNRPSITAYQRTKPCQAVKNRSTVGNEFRTFWRRVWAGAIDGAVFGPLFLINAWVWTSFKEHPVLLLLWFILSSIAIHIYDIVFHGLFGQTLGKMAVNVKVINVTGDKLTMPQAFRRDMVPLFFFALSLAFDGPKILHGIYPQNPAFVKFDFIFFLTLFSGMGWFFAEVVTMLTNKRRRAIHDYIAGSVVIKTDESANRMWPWLASLAVIVCFVVFFILPVRKEYIKKRDSLDHSKNSQNIVAELRPDESFPFIGFWKRDCKNTVGLAIDKTDDGKYSVSYCTSTDCYKPGTEMPNTSLVDDSRYRIIDNNTIEIQIADEYYWRYYRCTP